VGAPTDLHPVMVAADLARIENRQFASLDHAGIFPNGSFNSPVDLNTVGVQFFKGAAADTSHHHTIHPAPPQGTHGIAVTMLMVLIRIFEDLIRIRIQVYKYKKGRRPEMAVNDTVQSSVFFYRKSDFHFNGPPSYHANHCMAYDFLQVDKRQGCRMESNIDEPPAVTLSTNLVI
jgi:hypothetical protein